MAESGISAASILEKVRSRYATCTTYSDEGEIVQVMIRGPRSWERSTTRRLFRTDFERAGLFRFECREMAIGPESEWSRDVVWSDGRSFHSWSTLTPIVQSHDSLDRALSATGNTAREIPSLLRKDLEWNPTLPDATRTAIVGKEDIDGRACFLLESEERNHMAERLWIDADQFLIRKSQQGTKNDAKLRREMIEAIQDHPHLSAEDRARFAKNVGSSGDFRVRLTRLYRPSIDSAIDPANWSFSPPTE
jgi:hypothetical protein